MHLDQLYFNPPVIIFHFGFFFNHYVPLSSLAVFFNKAKKEGEKKDEKRRRQPVRFAFCQEQDRGDEFGRGEPMWGWQTTANHCSKIINPSEEYSHRA